MPRQKRDTLFIASDEEFSPTKRCLPFDDSSSISSDDYEQQDDFDNEEERYCLCRGIEEGWMIACESCREWFHGDCVSLRQLEDEQFIEVYACPPCTEEGLAETVWRNSKAEDRYVKRMEEMEMSRMMEREMEKRSHLEKMKLERKKSDERAFAVKKKKKQERIARKHVPERTPAPTIVEEDVDESMGGVPIEKSSLGLGGRQEDSMDCIAADGEIMDLDDMPPEPMEVEPRQKSYAVEGMVFVHDTVGEDMLERMMGRKSMGGESVDIEETYAFSLVKRMMVKDLFVEILQQ